MSHPLSSSLSFICKTTLLIAALLCGTLKAGAASVVQPNTNTDLSSAVNFTQGDAIQPTTNINMSGGSGIYVSGIDTSQSAATLTIIANSNPSVLSDIQSALSLMDDISNNAAALWDSNYDPGVHHSISKATVSNNFLSDLTDLTSIVAGDSVIYNAIPDPNNPSQIIGVLVGTSAGIPYSSANSSPVSLWNYYGNAYFYAGSGTANLNNGWNNGVHHLQNGVPFDNIYHALGGLSYFSLNSVYSLSGTGNNKIDITVNDGAYLALVGDNYSGWVTSNSGAASSLSPLVPNALYVDTNNSLYYFTDSSGNIITSDASTPSPIVDYINYTNITMPASADPVSITGPYNVYNGLGVVTLQGAANLVIDTNISISGVNFSYPIIITNAFSFQTSNGSASAINAPGAPISAQLILNSDLIATDPSIGSFGTFSGGGGLILNVPNNSDGSSNPTTFSGVWDQNSTPWMWLFSDAIITDPSVSYLGTSGLGVGSDSTPAPVTLIIQPTMGSATGWVSALDGNGVNEGSFANNGISISFISPYKNSTLILDSSTANDTVHFYTSQNPIGGMDINNNPIDLEGNVVLRAITNPLTIDAGTAQETLGSYDSNGLTINRLQALTIEGDHEADVILPVYSQNLILNSSAPINIIQPSWLATSGFPNNTMGAGGTLDARQDVVTGSSLTMSAGDDGSNPAVYTTFNLGTYSIDNNSGAATTSAAILNAGATTIPSSDSTTITSASALVFSGNLVANTAFEFDTNSGLSKGSAIVIDGDVICPGIFDISGVTSLTINLIQDGSVPSNNDNFSFFLFGSSDHAAITPPTIPLVLDGNNPTLIFNTLGTPNQLVDVTWNIDTITNPITDGSGNTTAGTATNGMFRLYATVTRRPQNLSGGAAVIYDALTASADSAGNLTLTPEEATTLTAVGGAPTAADGTTNLEALVVTATDQLNEMEVMDTASNQLSAQASTATADEASEAPFLESTGSGASAGDSLKRGVWLSGVVHRAKQKAYSNSIGYKIGTNGFTLGADTRITEDSLIGFAWIKAQSILRHSGNLKDNKSNTNSNIFSVYGLITMENNWSVFGQLSYGLGNTKAIMMRPNRMLTTFSRANYDSRFYNISCNLTKKIALSEDKLLSIEPLAGLSYWGYKSKAYKEYGGVTNFLVGGRNSSGVEGRLGLKLMKRIDFDAYTFRPSIYANTHINIHEREDNVKIRLSDTPTVAVLPKSKASRAWYAFGTSLKLYKGDLELGLGYELQLDKKYVANQGTVKVRWEF